MKRWDLIFHDESDGGGSGEQQPGKTFTQAELDTIIADRLGRERAKYQDYDQLKTKADQFDQSERQKLGEIERLKLEKADAENQLTQALAMSQANLIRAEVLERIPAFATKDGLKFRPDAIAAVIKLLDTSGMKLEKDGSISGVDQALTSLAQDNAFLLQQPTANGHRPVSPTNPSSGRGGDAPALTDAMKERLLGRGRGTTFFDPRPDGLKQGS